jgi:hypothetical protein
VKIHENPVFDPNFPIPSPNCPMKNPNFPMQNPSPSHDLGHEAATSSTAATWRAGDGSTKDWDLKKQKDGWFSWDLIRIHGILWEFMGLNVV